MSVINPEKIAQITEELDSLEKNEINGWDKIYPNLYNFLHEIIIIANAESYWGKPNIGILFRGEESDKIIGHCLSNGTMQINFGSTILKRNFFSETNLDEAPKDLNFLYEELVFLTKNAIISINEKMILNAKLELKSLEINNVNNWNILYPHLFTMLNRIVIPICIKAGFRNSPSIAISFEHTQRYNACAQILANSTKQLIIGSELIRNFLLQEEVLDDLFEQFQWIIAHEIAHFSDPIFQKYAKYSFLFFILNYTAQLIIIIGLSAKIIPTVFAHNFIVLAPILIFIGILGVIINEVLLIFLHRNLEYRADAISLQLAKHFSLNNIEKALSFMNEKIRTELHLNKIAWLYKTRLHPSQNRRINYLKIKKFE